MPFKTKFQNLGFSLLEMLVVIFILMFIVLVITPRIYKPERKVKNIFKEFNRINKRLVNLSTLYEKDYRLVIDISVDGEDRYWVEKKEQVEKKEDEDEEETLREDYFIDESFFEDPKPLALLDIVELQSLGGGEGVSEGQAYIDYSPKGLAQETVIHFFRASNQAYWSLYLNPVTRNFELIDGKKDLADFSVK